MKNQSRASRFLRLVFGGAFFLIPFIVVVLFQANPTSADNMPDYGDLGNDSFAPSLQISVTQTYTAQQTVMAPTFVAQTLTAIPATQTAIAANQTAVAAQQTADAQPTSTAQFIDVYEPNDTIATAHTTTKGTVLTSITLWPLGDIDYFRFLGKSGSAYEIFTRDLTGDLDTTLKAYNTSGVLIAENDDYLEGKRDSLVEILANADGYYYVRVENKAPTNPANKTYRLEVREVDPPTPTPTITVVPSTDACDIDDELRNDTFQTACLIVSGEGNKAYDFVPAQNGGVDQDFYRMWVREGFKYTCETSDLSSFTDTKMHVLDSNGQLIITSDNQEPGDLSSIFDQRVWFTGWIYFQIVPVNAPEYDLSDRYTYDFGCAGVFPTATPTNTPFPTNTPAPPTATFTPFPTLTPSLTPDLIPPTATRRPTSGGTGSGGGTGSLPPTATFTPIATFTPVVVVIEPTIQPPTPTPFVIINPLPTATASSGGGLSISTNVTVYYDENNNFTPEITEGIMDVAVALYDNATGQLLAFGYTNDAGIIQIGPIMVSGAVRLEVPFLNYQQIIVSNQPDIRVRVAPSTLPGQIP